jgi:hypothetical protein
MCQATVIISSNVLFCVYISYYKFFFEVSNMIRVSLLFCFFFFEFLRYNFPEADFISVIPRMVQFHPVGILRKSRFRLPDRRVQVCRILAFLTTYDSNFREVLFEEIQHDYQCTK